MQISTKYLEFRGNHLDRKTTLRPKVNAPPYYGPVTNTESFATILVRSLFLAYCEDLWQK